MGERGRVENVDGETRLKRCLSCHCRDGCVRGRKRNCFETGRTRLDTVRYRFYKKRTQEGPFLRHEVGDNTNSEIRQGAARLALN